jgi:hypothetical protein
MSNRVATPLHVHKCMANSSSASLSLSLSLPRCVFFSSFF